MKERPILFSAPMVRAILDGRKTMTRRVVKVPGGGILDVEDDMVLAECVDGETRRVPCPYGQPGDRLWVRETHSIFQTHGQHRPDDKRWGPWGGLPTSLSPDGTQIAYFREGFDRADPGRWRPSIHMPRWASRITLEVTDVRVERLQDISEADAIAEGCETEKVRSDFDGSMIDVPKEQRVSDTCAVGWDDCREWFADQWESINGAGSWDTNPWVWVVEFSRINPPIGSE